MMIIDTSKFRNILLNIFAKSYYKIKFPGSNIRSWIGRNPNIESPVRISENVKNNSDVSIGKYTFIAENCFLGPNLTSIGRYCSISQDCIIAPNNHPLHKFSTSAVFYSKSWDLVDIDLSENFNKKKVIIENDVWIGAQAIILNDIKVSNGSVVAAGAVVTKDVPPYSIVAGVPAKILGYRFEENVINQLIKSEWWKIDVNELIKTRDKNISEFLILIKDKKSELQ